jgi:hypothetical protein
MIKSTIQVSVGIVFLTGLIFKFAHYPGAGVLLVIALVSGIMLSVVDLYIGKKTNSLSLTYKCALGAGAAYILGLLFKMMHWPGADIITIISMSGLALLLAFSALKSQTWFYALLPLLFSVTLIMALFKIMHWPQPNHLLYGSYFAYSSLLIGVLIFRGLSLNKTNIKIGQRFGITGGLVFILYLVELKLKLYPNLFEISQNSTRIIQAILMSGIVFSIQSILVTYSKSEVLERDLRVLKSTQGIYLLMLFMLVLVSAT